MHRKDAMRLALDELYRRLRAYPETLETIELGLGKRPGYFRKARRRQEIRFSVLLDALFYLGVEPREFFVTAYGHLDPLEVALSLADPTATDPALEALNQQAEEALRE